MVSAARQMPQAIGAAGAIVHYLKHQLRRKVDHLRSLRCDAPANYVVLDAATQTNLELVDSRSVRDTSLLAVLDRTVTPMGGRKLRGWILQPLRDLLELGAPPTNDRRSAAGTGPARVDSGELKSIRDIERAAGRLSQASGNARDLVALKISLQQIPKLKAELQNAARSARVWRNVGYRTNRGESRITGRSVCKARLHEMPELAAKLSQRDRG